MRGAIEHLYTANVRPTITDVGWARLPTIVKHAYLGGKIAQIGKEVAAAAEQGGFDHEDMHLTRTSLRLTPDAAEGADRDQEEPEAEERHAIAVMMLFEAAAPRSFGPPAGTSGAPDDFEDLASPDQQAG